MRFPFFRNRDSVKNGILISIRRTGDGFHPGLFTLMMTVIKCTVKNRNRQFARRSKREVLFCELSDTKNVECVTKDNYSCDYISFEVLNFTIQISNEKLAVALYKLSNKERDVILLRYFQSMSDQEIAELYHVSRSAIYRRRSNGLKKLKTVLKERN